ncbi:hypothetical protein PL8927_600020 [Planktothrix serta PCC 8927]|uniref:Uncharacterized protein n=1 Tax=Planktothrix serta PCC 8927 TaxID=671068 RepID=A0A7Z9BTN4_9CYAN|nr:hypothetical protein PL8927_600020 [Planktothrix serta PCC 8927]
MSNLTGRPLFQPRVRLELLEIWSTPEANFQISTRFLKCQY